jgi:hypothetical protein
MPKTKLGKWAGALLAVFLVSLIALLIFIHVIGLRRGSVEVWIAGLLMEISGMATFVTGAVSLFKFKDRSLIVILATIFGFFAILIVSMMLVDIL